MMPVVAGALSPDRQEVIKMLKTKMTPCATGSVNNTETMVLKGHSGAELHIYFLVRLESIYYQIFFYSKIVPNCAVAK